VAIGSDVQAHDADLDSWAGVTRASGFDTFAATPSSANLAGLVSDETGTGALVFANSPTLVTPALGTPASGVVTNLTGTASININGTVGATTPSTGAFTSLSASTSLTTPLVTNAGTVALSATGANIVTASTNGVERLRIDASGNILVSESANQTAFSRTVSAQYPTASNTSVNNVFRVGNRLGTAFPDRGASIKFVQSGTTNSFGELASNIQFWTWRVGVDEGAERFRITSAGDVGIGTTSPAVKLDVVGNIRTSLGVMVKGSGLTLAASQITFDQLNTSVSRVMSWGPDTSTAGSLSFWTLSSNATVGAERMRITSAGDVGIGTTTPGSKLDVLGAFRVRDGTNTIGQFCGSSGGLVAGHIGTLTNVPIAFYTNSSGPRLTIDTSGNVGIGTASPGTTLDVQAANASFRVYGTGASDSPQFQLRNGSQIWQQIVDGADSNKWKLRTGGGTTVLNCDPSAFGLAVTGALSATGALAIGNTVNTVTPTLPNRTITMVIGGTTYYIHAKTTND
jgi:hypothetical protein